MSDLPRKPRKKKLLPLTPEDKKALGLPENYPHGGTEIEPEETGDKNPSNAEHDDYEVGYGKPPKAYQYKPGQSGNLKGRNKGARNLKTDLAEELAETLTIRENGKTRKISKRRAMIKSTMAKALKGDPRAIKLVLDMIGSTGLESDQTGDPDNQDLSAVDREILEAFADKVTGKDKKR
jgi:Family of unknown function (DUF5681)